MNETPERKAKLQVGFAINDTLAYIARNYDDIVNGYKIETFAGKPYAFGLNVLKGLADQQLDEPSELKDFLTYVFHVAARKEPEFDLFFYVTHPDYPQYSLIPLTATSNKNDLPLNNQLDIIEYCNTEEVVVLKPQLDEEELDLLDSDEIRQNTTIVAQLNPDYVKSVLEHDEERIQKALATYEKQLRKELKETGRLACNKPRLKLS